MIASDAEVERLKRLEAARDLVADRVVRERDEAQHREQEALAQVAALLEFCRGAMLDTSTLPISARARALLDGIIAIEQYRQRFTALTVVGSDGTKDIAGVPRDVHNLLLDALARWKGEP